MEMHDEYDKKRDMMKMLLTMLKSDASSEVSKGLNPPMEEKAPEGMPKDAKGLSVEKISVMPGDEKMADEAPSMADAVMPKGEPMTSESPMDEEMEDEPMDMHAFGSLMKKKKK